MLEATSTELFFVPLPDREILINPSFRLQLPGNLPLATATPLAPGSAAP